MRITKSYCGSALFTILKRKMRNIGVDRENNSGPTRSEIDEAVKEFLDRGGRITKINFIGTEDFFEKEDARELADTLRIITEESDDPFISY